MTHEFKHQKIMDPPTSFSVVIITWYPDSNQIDKLIFPYTETIYSIVKKEEETTLPWGRYALLSICSYLSNNDSFIFFSCPPTRD